MTRQDLFELAARNMRNARLRNALTTIGIAVGVASLVAMMSLGIGLQRFANQQLMKSGMFQTVFVTSRQDPRNMDEDRDNNAGTKPEESPALDDAARAKIAALPGVEEVAPEVRATAEVEYGDHTNFTMLAGLPWSARDEDSLEKMKGRFFTSATAEEAILQRDFAKKLDTNPENLLGKTIVVRYARRRGGSPEGFQIERQQKSFTIVGLLDEQPYGGMRMISRARVFVPTQTALAMDLMQPADTQQLVRADPAERNYSMLTVRMVSATQAEAVEDAVKKMHFSAYSYLDATRSMRRFFAVLDMFLGIFGSLALAVASLAIVNTLVMAVLERRREIGIMKAIGASDSDVKRVFFAEAATMGFLGGVIGVVLGWLIGRAINLGANLYLQRLKMPPEGLLMVPLWLALAAVLFAVLVSVVAGIYPAARAARLDPVEALRYE
jgi:putative ABC transport system permease protein